MRLLPGYNPTLPNQSIDSFALVNHVINSADMIPTVFELFKEEYSPLTSILNQKGQKTKGMYEGFRNNSYRTVGSNHVMYKIKNARTRKMRLKANSSGVTFTSSAYTTEPGKNQTPFYIYSDSNWAAPKEVVELADNSTLLYIIDDQMPVEVDGGVWRYEVKLITNTVSDYVDTQLLQEGMEFTPTMTMYEHDFSETGSEKYVFDGWGHTYLTLQRLKYSWSGTAEYMKQDLKWVEHTNSSGKDKRAFLTQAQYEMFERASQYSEYAMVFGKGTVTAEGDILMKDKKGRDIMAGDGILNQGEGAWEYPYNEFTMKWLESIMGDIDIRVGMDGKKEVVLLGAQQVTQGFSRLMRENGVTLNSNIEGTGASKGINNSYDYYEFDGVRVIVKRWRWFDNVARPSMQLPDGTRKGSWDGIFVPLGTASGGQNGIELVQLRPMAVGEIEGMNKGGKIATSVDGGHMHLLFQTGVICQNKITRIYRPMPRTGIAI